MDPIPPRYLEALRDVYDPCCQEKGISVVDMGLIRSVTVAERHARVELLLTSGWCPFASRVLDEVGSTLEQLPEIDTAEVEITWDEAWTTDQLSPSAAGKLRFLPEPAAIADRELYISEHQPSNIRATPSEQRSLT